MYLTSPWMSSAGHQMMMLRPLLLNFLAAFCVLPDCVAAAPASTAPVVCGRPGRCTEAAGLKAVNELHEVR